MSEMVEVRILKPTHGLNEGERAIFEPHVAQYLVRVGLVAYVDLPPSQPAAEESQPVATTSIDAAPVNRMMDSPENKKSLFKRTR